MKTNGMTIMAEAVNIAQSERRASGGLLAPLREAWQRWRTYRCTYAELSALSTRELSDLGISRGMISRLAQEAAQGRRPPG